jgi:hypothetical protein
MCRFLAQQPYIWSTKVASGAARNGHADTVQWLLNNGYGSTSLVDEAAEGGHAELCERLIDVGAIWTGRAPACAARNGHEGLMRRLLQLREQDPQRRSLDRHSSFDLVSGAAHGLGFEVFQVCSRQSSWQSSRQVAVIVAVADAPRHFAQELCLSRKIGPMSHPMDPFNLLLSAACSPADYRQKVWS